MSKPTILGNGAITAGTGTGFGYARIAESLSVVLVGVNIGGTLKKLIVIGVSSLLLATSAFARTWQIDVIMSHGDKEVPRQFAIAMTAFARAKFDAIGIKIKIGRVSYTKLINPQYDVTSYRLGVYWWQKHLPPRKNIIRHVITPPFFYLGKYYLAGVAPGICVPRWKYAMATSNAEMFSGLGEDRFYQSAVALTHEQGHILGAKHTITHTLMNYGALGFSDIKDLQFSEESKHQIHNCLGE